MRHLRYVATQLKPVLDRQGVKSGSIAKEIGLSPSLLSMVIRGERTLGKEDAEKIANVFRLPIEMLFRAEGEKP